jgi:hypothetical protein
VRHLAALSPLLLAACFSTALPDGARIQCDEDEDCPSQMQCTGVKLCVSRSEADNDPPQVSDAEVSPALARADAEVVITFRVDETLLEPAVVLLRRNGERDLVAVPDEIDDDELTQRYVYRPNGQEAEASYVAVAELVDTSGNVSSEVALGGVTFDFVAPSPVNVTLAAAHVKSGDEIVLDFEVDEPVASLPDVVARPVSGQQLALVVAADGDRFVARYEAQGIEAEVGYALAVTVADDAGNERETEVATVALDFTPPGLSAVDPPGTLRLGETTSLSVAATEALRAPPTPSSGAGAFELVSSDSHTFNYRLLVLDAAVEGTHAVVVDGAIDLAGNRSDGVSVATVEVDATAPTLDGLPNDTPAYREGQDIAFTFTTDDDLGALTVELDDGVELTCSEDTPLAWTCRHTITSTDAEGQRFVRVRASDETGNERLAAFAILIDRTPPDVIADSVVVTLTPAPGSPLTAVQALPQDGSATLSFLTTEEVVGVPELVPSPTGGLQSTGAPQGSQTAWSYALSLAAATSFEGDVELSVKLTDAVGNESQPIVATVRVDTIAPPAPDTAGDGVVLARRTPWGAEATSGAPRTELVGAPGAAEALATLIWYGDETLTTELARDPVGGDGAFGPLALPSIDVIETWVRAVDSAGNPSAGAKVLDGEWIATLTDKMSGRAFPNPNALLSRTHSVDQVWLDRLGNPIVGAAEHDGAALALPADGDALVTTGGLRTRRITADDGTTYPEGRLYHVQAYDSVRGRVVLYGGDCATCADTWEWDGTRWYRRDSTHTPPRLQAGTGGYDPVLGVTVLYGGVIDGFQTGVFPVASGETWTWDGVDWTEHIGASPPEMSVRAFGQGTYVGFDLTLKDTGEVVHGGVIVYGGTEFTRPLDDMWVFLGDRWAEVDQGTAADTPQGRAGSALAWDEGRDVLVLHGGLSTQEGARTGTYTFDGSEWVLVDATGPSLTTVGAAYDRAAQKVVLLGTDPPNGYTQLKPTNPPPDNGPCEDDIIKAWEWDGVWTARTLGPPPVYWTKHPDRCAQLQPVYDVARQEVIAIGWLTENNSYPFPDEHLRTWIYRLEPDAFRVINPISTPPRRQGASLVWDPKSGGLLLGGVEDEAESPANVHADVWFYGGGDWQVAWWADGDRTSYQQQAVYVPTEDHVVIFGGHDGSDLLGASDVFPGYSSIVPLGSAVEPPARMGGAVAYDEGRDAAVLFGGLGAGDTLLNDTWELAAGEWSLVTPATTTPVPRAEHAMAWDAERGEIVMYGGRLDASDDEILSGETWVWDGDDWALLTPTTEPEARARHSLTFHERRRKVTLVGGDSTVGLVNPVWEWDGGDWAPVTAEGLPNNIRDHGAVYDLWRDVTMLFGGASGVGGQDVTWHLSDDGRPGHSFVAELAASGLPLSTFRSLSVRALAGGDGGDPGAPLPGAALDVWEQGRWVRVDTNDVDTADLSALGELSWTRDDARPFELLSIFDRVLLRVEPLGENERDAAVVATDYVELTVRYRLP